MNAFRWCVAAIAFAMLHLAPNPARAADEPQRVQLPGGRPGPGGMQSPGMLGQGNGDLLSSEAVEKLKLSAEQKGKYAKISTEYQEKHKAASEKTREALQKDNGKIREVMQKMRIDAEKLRTEYLAKLEALLNDEQNKTLAEVKNQQPGGLQFPGGVGPFQRRGLPQEDPRLGALIERPSPTLVEQLGLPKDQGMVLPEVKEGSAAAKAGLKAHDILLEVGGRPLPSDEQAFGKLVDEFKAVTPLDAVVLRKGQKETIQGLTLPEADPKARERGRAGSFAPMPLRPAGARGIPGKPNAAGRFANVPLPSQGEPKP